MKKIIIIVALGLFFIAGIGYLYSKCLTWQVSQNFKVISNGNLPQKPTVNLKFELELTIYKEGWNPEGLFIDGDYNIYTFSDETLMKFNPQGVQVGEKSFKRGQGPGDFRSKDPFFSNQGLLYIADTLQRRITCLNDKYEVVKIHSLKFFFDIFCLDSKDNWYLLVGNFLTKTRDKIKFVLSKFSPSGNLLYEITDYETGPKRDTQGIIHQSFYGPQLRYKLDSHDNVYYTMTNNYEIHIVSAEGKPIKAIQKKANPRSITKQEIVKYLPKNSPSGRVVTDIPEAMPALADIFVLENGSLLVVTFDNDDAEPTLAGDLFDPEGRYRARIQVPKYHSWYWLFMSAKSNALIKKNKFYTIESDPDEIKFYIRRYRIISEGIVID